jgi:hypothetical protein
VKSSSELRTGVVMGAFDWELTLGAVKVVEAGPQLVSTVRSWLKVVVKAL